MFRGFIADKSYMKGLLFLAVVFWGIDVASAAECICPKGQNPITNWDNKRTSCVDESTGRIMGGCSTTPLPDVKVAASCACPSDMLAYVWDKTQYCYDTQNGGTQSCEKLQASTQTSSPTKTSTDTSTKTSSTSKTEKKIEETGKNTTGKQADAQRAAGTAFNYGASSKATMAIVRCADGANSEREAPGSGEGSLGDCQQKFADADKLVEMSNKTGTDAVLTPDEEVLGAADAQDTLAKFEKNFGVTQDDYVSRMLNSRSRMSEFSDMLKSEITEERLKQIAENAKVEAPVVVAEEASGVIVAGSAKKKVDTSLRDSLKKKLAEGRGLASLKQRGQSGDDRSGVHLQDLQPDQNLQQVFQSNGEERERELTIFDVVRSKYREFTARQKLN